MRKIEDNGILGIEILDAIQALRSPALDEIMKDITFLGDGGWFWIAVTLLCLGKYKKTGDKKYKEMCVELTTALLVSLFLGEVMIKNFVRRPRPFTIENFPIIIDRPLGFSFVSGHTFSSFSAATVIFKNNKKLGRLALILAGAIGFSRLYLYVHFLSDVITGAAMGVANGMITVEMVRRYSEKKMDEFDELEG